MALASWKSFNFFNVSQAKPPDEKDSNLGIFEGAEISAVTSGSDNLFVGEPTGRIHILNSSFKPLRSFPANDSGIPVTKLIQIEGTSLLISISEDLSSEPELKVWALDKTEKKTGLPRCQSTLTIHNGGKQFPVSAIATLPDLSLLAIGFANGAVTLVKGDLIHDRGAKQRTVFTSEEPITNLAFAPPPSTGAGQATLFISTTGRILSLLTTSKGHGGTPKVLENQGCGVGCMASLRVDGTSSIGAMGGESTDGVVVVRDDAIYYYSSAGRGGCYAHEGPKQLVTIFKDYICLVQPPSSGATEASTIQKTKNTFKRLIGTAAAGSATDNPLETTRFTILDTDLKFVACQEAVVGGVRAVFSEWDDLFIVGLDGKLWRYHEKELSQKLEILYQRNLYTLAISLAQKSGLEDSRLKDIYRRYADYLYDKSEWDTAMQWYIKSIGDDTAAEVSSVIRKFLDTQRIGNLIEYLEELHRKSIAGSEHTTLLLNCYAKTRDAEKLDKFIKESLDQDPRKGDRALTSGSTLDIETAISMCRQSGYFEQAVYLAERAGEDEVVVGILGEELGKWNIALGYLRRLSPDKVFSNLLKYAKVLLKEIPAETTELFVEYYSENYVPLKAVVQNEANGDSENHHHHHHHHQDSQQNGGGSYIPGITNIANIGNIGNIANIGTYASFLTTQIPYIGIFGGQTTEATSKEESVTVKFEKCEKIPYTAPRPRTAFSSFVDHPREFITFLEALLREREELRDEDKADIHTTLFEMYLLRATECRRDGDEAGQAEWEGKAKAIIQSKEELVDTSNVLLLSHLSNFRSGTILVREKQGLVFDIFRSCTSSGDTEGALNALRKYGDQEPQLYPAALAYLTSSPEVLQAAGEDELRQILQTIDKRGLMKPLQVVQTLSNNAVATVGMLKKYLGETIERERREIRNNRKLIASYRAETAKRQQEIEDITTKPVDFQATRCSSCGTALELPVVHFLCKHSFHERCINRPIRSPGGYHQDDAENDLECPTCEADNKTIRTLRRAQDETADRHDLFKASLDDSKDGFGTVAEFMGKGVMVSRTDVEFGA